MPDPIVITKVRHNEITAAKLLQKYVFGGMYGGPRVPRGIDPETVSKFLAERLKPDSGPSAYQRATDVCLFYERHDVIPLFALALSQREASAADVRRSAFALQAIGELGTANDAERAANYFDHVLVPNPHAPEEYPTLLACLVSLAPNGSPDRLRARIDRDLAEAERTKHRSEEDLRRHGILSAIQRNQVSHTLNLVEGRKRLFRKTADERRDELVQIYLGRSPLSGDPLEVWSARLLRHDAMKGNAAAVHAAFAAAIDKILEASLDPQMAGFLVTRACQAILYLQGELSPAHREAYEKLKDPALNFLWDDP